MLVLGSGRFDLISVKLVQFDVNLDLVNAQSLVSGLQTVYNSGLIFTLAYQ